jgi:hypothetical protein
MALWLLKRNNAHPNSISEHSVCNGFVVRAATAQLARELAATQAVNEGAESWRDLKMSSCVEISTYGPMEVLLCDYHEA